MCIHVCFYFACCIVNRQGERKERFIVVLKLLQTEIGYRALVTFPIFEQ